MGFNEILDQRIAAYAPVTSRLLYDFRDQQLAARNFIFPGLLPTGPITVAKNTADSGVGVFPPTTWFDFPGAAFSLYVPRGTHGLATLLSCIPFADATVSAVGNVFIRLSDGTHHGPPLEVLPLGGMVPRVEWCFPVATWGYHSWVWQCAFFVSSGSCQAILDWRFGVPNQPMSRLVGGWEAGAINAQFP